MADMLVLKTDILNELRNKKYYIQNELERVAVKVSDAEISHKERVERVIELTKELTSIDSSIKLVDAIFAAPQPKQAPAPVAAQAPVEATNVVEASAAKSE